MGVLVALSGKQTTGVHKPRRCLGMEPQGSGHHRPNLLIAFPVNCLVYHTVSPRSSLSLLRNAGFSEDQKGKRARDRSREKQNRARPGDNFRILPSQYKYLPILLFVFFHIPVCPRAIKLLVCTGGSKLGQHVG